ncbi:hypothetical protein, partial [Escherichia coli]|uniref:hypothetical protein n=1 Tax=Escherichia coli TaxID=562 RepID=UPI001BC89F70
LGGVPRLRRRTGCRAAHRAAARLAPAGRPSSPRSKANASVGLTATALSPFAGGELQGSGEVIRAVASC